MSFSGDLYPSVASKVMTTKGDMVDYDSERQRLGIGSANQILQVKSSLPSWETVPLADTVLTTQGSILYEGASGLAELTQSTDGFVLTTKGASANPVWASVSASPTITTFNVDLGSSFTTSSTSFVEITDMTTTKPTIASGECIAVFWISIQNDNDGKLYTRYDDDTTAVSYGKMEGHIDADQTICCGDQSSADGQVYSGNTKVSAGNTTIHSGERQSRITGFGIG